MENSSDQRRVRRTVGFSLLGAAASAGLLAGILSTSVGAAPPSPLAELIRNGDFESGETDPWWWTQANPATVVDGRLCADNAAGTTYPWDAVIGQDGLVLTAGTSYTLTYTASATSDLTITTTVQENVDPWTQISVSEDALTAEPQTFTQEFTATEDNAYAQLAFAFGGGAEDVTFCVDDVSLTDGGGDTGGTTGGDTEGTTGGDTEGTTGGDTEGTTGGDTEGTTGGDTEGTTGGQTEGTTGGQTEGTSGGDAEGTDGGVIEGLVEGLIEGVIGGDGQQR